MNSNLKNYIKILIVCLLSGVWLSPCSAAKPKKNKVAIGQEIAEVIDRSESSYRKGEWYMNCGFNLAFLSMCGLSFFNYQAQTDASSNQLDFLGGRNILEASLCLIGAAGGTALMAIGKADSERAMEELLGESRKLVRTLKD